MGVGNGDVMPPGNNVEIEFFAEPFRPFPTLRARIQNSNFLANTRKYSIRTGWDIKIDSAKDKQAHSVENLVDECRISWLLWFGRFRTLVTRRYEAFPYYYHPLNRKYEEFCLRIDDVRFDCLGH